MQLTDKNSNIKNKWLMWPFAEQFFTVVLFVCVGPGVWGAGVLTHGNWILGMIILLIWVFPFFKLITFLNTNNTVRFAISIPCTILILISGFLLPATMFNG
jgi:hypothetical protein